MNRFLFIACLTLACGEDEEPALERLAPPAPGEGFQLSVEVKAPPHAEIWKCAIYRIPTRDFAAVNRVHYLQTPGLHHMTVSTPGLHPASEPSGMYDCDAIYSTL